MLLFLERNLDYFRNKFGKKKNGVRFRLVAMITFSCFFCSISICMIFEKNVCFKNSDYRNDFLQLFYLGKIYITNFAMLTIIK